jgi:hypothetical protein
MSSDKLPFNSWSREKIKMGMKICTSRKKIYTDSRVYYVTPKLPFWFIKKYLYKPEGATSPEELQRVIDGIFRRPVAHHEEFYVHFGDFKEEKVTA